jgi:hypothetical protein
MPVIIMGRVSQTIRRLGRFYDPDTEFNFVSDLQSSRDALNLIEPMHIFKWIHQAYIDKIYAGCVSITNSSSD